MREECDIAGKPRPDGEIVLHGIGVSPGIVVGNAVIIGAETDHVEARRIKKGDIGKEIARLETALIETRRQIREIQRNVETRIGRANAGILDAHLMVLDDTEFVGDILRSIETDMYCADYALRTSADKYIAILSGLEDDYLRERTADVRDVARRLVRNLVGSKTALGEIKTKCILIANDLAPSETASLPRDLVVGLATDLGSPTSHSAMMARGMEIPAVVGMGDITSKVKAGNVVLIDGNKGILILSPTQERLAVYGKLRAERRHIESGLTNLKHVPAETRDGRRIVLAANIESPDDVATVQQYGAEGVGLFRTEYAYLCSTELPTEDALAESYGKAASLLSTAPVVIRTIDIGGDKLASYLGLPAEHNPFLGLRSIRLSLTEPEMFKVQLRAILRASVHRNVSIMYPMISSAEEVLKANALLEEAKAELRNRKVEFDPDIQVGVMIETPSAALTAELIAPHVKFFSLGTNDLIQYAMAVDRGNERVAHLYQPTHPGILRLIRMTVDAARNHGLWTSCCGEMASDPVITPLLAGLGVDKLSMPPAAVPLVKDAIRSMNFTDAAGLAEAALKASTTAEILGLCRELIRQKAPEILALTG